ncbi:hypothetical protein A1D23_05310 [Chelonobacter oris]|uniref:DNA internalization-related competence protein ComEC/Rec2 n=1 Tax=Chelonobacter oris TaxID=505317 RepID=UPI0024479237|nr:DNA internalization-related competence protein ComEC/Rec2 [Chelonobacter oris]MDH2999512.1 hypothetical protein [Chelonobacter oris]
MFCDPDRKNNQAGYGGGNVCFTIISGIPLEASGLMKLNHLAICWLLSLSQIFFMPADWLDYQPVLMGASVFVLATTVFSRRYRTWLWWLCSLLLFSGYLQGQLAAVLSDAEKIAELRRTVIDTELEVIGLRRIKENPQVVARVDLTEYQLGRVKIQLNWQLPQEPHLGDIWRVKLSLRPLSSRLNEGGFNRQRWLLSQSVLASATLKQGEWQRRKSDWRQQKLQQVIAQTDKLRYQGVILALAFGERAWLNDEDWRDFRESGTAHLIAISGLHIGLVAGLAWGLVRLCQIVLPSRYLSYHLPHLAALAAAVFYAYLADFLIPTQRALWGYGFWLLLMFCRIYLPPWKLLLLLVAWLSWLDPLSVLNESFWLSCGAVAVLCFYYRFFPLTRLQWQGRSLKQVLPAFAYRLAALVHLQFGLLLLFTPLQVLIFQAVPLGTFLSNLVLVPLFGMVLVPLILLQLFGIGFGWEPIDFILVQSFTVLQWLPNHYLALSYQQQWIVSGGCAAVLLLLSAYRTLRQDKEKVSTTQSNGYRTALCGLILSVGLILSIAQTRQKPDWRLVMLDVGQGLATLIIRGNKAVLFDSGQSWQGGSMAEAEILPYLRRNGLQLEQLIVSHDDNDHAGGVADLRRAFPSALLVRASNRGYGATHSRYCRQGEYWQWQGFQFRALAPQTISDVAKNRDSCVLLVSRDHLRFVLSGDIDIHVENRIAADIGKIDWLQVGHHGSNGSTGWLWLAKLQPTAALISSSLHNQWGFPHNEVIQRLKQTSSAVYNTALDGQISIDVRNGRWRISTARNRLSPWYQIIIGLEKEIQLE